MQVTVYGVNWCDTPIGFVAWADNPLTFQVKDTRITWRSRSQHDPGDGPYRYWGYWKKGKLPSYGNKQLIPTGYYDRYDVSDSDHYEVLYPEGGKPTVRHWWWGKFYNGDGWGAEQHILNYGSRHWSGDSYANKDVWYTYGSHRSPDDPPSLHWDDRSWFGVENQARWESFGQGGKLRPKQAWTFEGSSPDSGPTMSMNFFDTIDLGVEGSVNNALSRVYTAACTSLPRTSMNNIANVLDLVGLLKTFVGGHLDLPNADWRSIKELLTSGWMGYRYAYGTTKMDIEDGVSLVNRLRDIARADSIRSNAVEHFTYGDTEYIVKCSVTLGSQQLSDVQSFAERWGIALSAYNIWDMIPYSFIVDWFLDIGGLLEYYEGYNFAMRLSPTAIWFSIAKVIHYSQSESETYYYRWSGQPPDTLPVYTSYTPGAATLIRRGLDVLALFL